MEGQFSDANKQEMIASFVEITAGQTPEVAIQFLQAAKWKLEEALQLFFVGHDRGVSAPSLHSPFVANPSPLPGNIAIPKDLGGGEDELRPPLPFMRKTLYGNPMLSAGASRRRHRRRDLRIMRHPRVLESMESATSAAILPQNLGSFHPPPFRFMFQGSFEQAKVAASAHDKWLLVIVESKKESNSHKLNLDAWSNEAVSVAEAIFQTINTNFILWEEDDHTSEGKKVCTFYKLDSIPAVFMIDPITGQKMKSWCETLDAANLLEDLVQFKDCSPRNHHATLSRKRQRGSYSISHNNEGKLHGFEYEEDQVQKAVSASLEGVKDSSALAASTKKVEEVSGSKLHSYPPLPEEPRGDKSLQCRVALRLPDGRRIQRDFMKTDPIQLLWSFCFTELGEAGARSFRLTQAISGTKSLDYESKSTMAESGMANSMIIVAWE